MEHNSRSRDTKKQQGAGMLMAVLALALLIVFTFMLTDYYKQQRLQAGLREQIEAGQQQLVSMESPDPALEQKLEEARVENNAARQALSSGAVNPREIIQALLGIAEEFDLKNLNLTTDKWTDKKAGESQYRYLPVTLNLKGTIQGLQGYLEKLENRQLFPALIIQNLTLSDIQDSVPALNGREPAREVRAVLSVSIVTRADLAEGY